MICLGYRFERLIRETQAVVPGANPNPDQILLVAVIVGITFGLMFQHSVWGILGALSGFRSERLLIRYYDEHVASVASESCDLHDHDE